MKLRERFSTVSEGMMVRKSPKSKCKTLREVMPWPDMKITPRLWVVWTRLRLSICLLEAVVHTKTGSSLKLGIIIVAKLKNRQRWVLVTIIARNQWNLMKRLTTGRFQAQGYTKESLPVDRVIPRQMKQCTSATIVSKLSQCSKRQKHHMKKKTTTHLRSLENLTWWYAHAAQICHRVSLRATQVSECPSIVS